MGGSFKWLPDLILLADHGGDIEAYYAAVYGCFCSDFKSSKPTLDGRQVAAPKAQLDGKERIFWHVTSEGGDEESRLPNLRRMERIGWPRAIIDRVGSSGVRSWSNRRRRGKRLVVALADFSYVVVLADRGEYCLLLTAYPVERSHRRRKLEKEFNNWKSSQKGKKKRAPPHK